MLGHYLLLEPSSENAGTREGRFVSEEYPPTGTYGSCFRFFYVYSGDLTDFLEVRRKTS